MKTLVKICFLTALLAGMASPLFSQKLLFEEDVENLFIKPKWGKNSTHFGHFYLGFGSYFNDEGTNQLAVVPFNSNQSKIGYRYKLKFFEHYAWGLDLSYNYNRYKIKQDDGNIFPDTLKHKKEIFAQNTFELGFYNRFNFHRRGNHIGKYLDLGVWGNLNVGAKHVFKDNPDNPILGASKSKTILRKLNYVNDLNWGLNARLGLDRFVFFGSYRLSDLLGSPFNSSAISLDPGRLVVGVEISLF